MNWVEILIIGFALAVDATVYSFSYGLILRTKRTLSSLWLALTVGLYQAGMPLVGYLFGHELKTYVEGAAPFLVLTVFMLLGGYIIYEAWLNENEEANDNASPLSFLALMVVGIATAIDAFAVGTGMALGNIGGNIQELPLLLSAVGIIGAITFMCSTAAFHSARLLHHLPTKWLETTAGLLLIGLGLNAAF
ncbi:MAG: hypothetical protein E7031_02565 [Akkermansiaceae bacterium]|nr:hypothetical protein [Akkermansiaceae bacterium]